MTDPAPDPVTDPSRLAALHRLQALDTPADPDLDALADLVRQVLDVPVALVTLVDEDRQFFKACLGLEEPWVSQRETPLSHSFCRHTVGDREPLVIQDAAKHPLVSDNPAIQDLKVAAYLGVPLITHDGQAVGTLCAIDHAPRSWRGEEVLLLQAVAAAALGRLELSARVKELEEVRRTLKQRETYFRALIERGLDGITVLDENGVVLYDSPNIARLLGHSPGERVGEDAWGQMHPDDVPGVQARFVELLAHPDESARVEFRYRHRDGRWIRLEGVGTNLLADPAVQGVVFNFRDVTRSRELEEEALQSQKLETVGEFTAGISHDFNNLLAVMTANAELLRDDLASGSDEALQDLEDLQAAARAGADLIRGLMTFSRRSEVALQATDLELVAEQTCRMLRRILPSSIHLKVSVPTILPAAQADPRAVEQVLLNLATNARDAMPGGGQLSIRLGTADLTAAELEGHPGAEPGRFVVLEVEDTGSGMDEKTLQKAFEPFFTTKPSGRGTGLGLATIARIVERHRGMIRVESEPGQGTRFLIHIPASSGEPAPPDSGAPIPPARGDETVLLVEDEEALRRTGQRVLERAGYRVLTAVDGQEAMEMLRSRKHEIHLVLSDMDMPRMTGTDLFREIRAMGSSIPFVLSTGYTTHDLPRGERIPEGIDLLPKPWSLEDLTRAVRRAVDSAGG